MSVRTPSLLVSLSLSDIRSKRRSIFLPSLRVSMHPLWQTQLIPLSHPILPFPSIFRATFLSYFLTCCCSLSRIFLLHFYIRQKKVNGKNAIFFFFYILRFLLFSVPSIIRDLNQSRIFLMNQQCLYLLSLARQNQLERISCR